MAATYFYAEIFGYMQKKWYFCSPNMNKYSYEDEKQPIRGLADDYLKPTVR